MATTSINPVLDKYFKDPNIDPNKKAALAKDLDAGAIDEAHAVQIVSSKYYPDIHDAAHQAVGKAAAGVVNALKNPLETINTVGGMATEALGKNTHEVVQTAKAILPKTAPTPEQQQANESTKAAALADEQSVGQELNSLGVTPPSTLTLDQKKELLQHARAIHMFGGVDLYGAAKSAQPIQEAGAAATEQFAKGTGNLVRTTTQVADVVNPVNIFSRITGIGRPRDVATELLGDNIQKQGEALAKNVEDVQKQAGVNTDTFAGNLGGFAGGLAAEIPWLLAAGGIEKAAKSTPGVAQFIKQYPKMAAGVDFALNSIGKTTIVEGQSTGNLPDLGTFAAYGAIDLILLGLEKAAGRLYNTAFKGTKGEERNLLKNYNTTVGKTAEEFGYAGSAESIKQQAQGANKKIFKEIMDKAKETGAITRDEFMSIADKMKSGFNELPDSAAKQEIFKAIDEVVGYYAPAKLATGDQLVGIIKNINKDLFGDGTKMVLSPKQVNSLVNEFKGAVKDLLPDEIKPLYAQYAKNKIIEQVMQDAEVQRLVARQLIGGAAGAGGAVTAGLATGQDPLTIVKNAFIYGITGALAARLSGNVAIKTVAGKTIKDFAKSDITDLAIKNVISYLSNPK